MFISQSNQYYNKILFRNESDQTIPPCPNPHYRYAWFGWFRNCVAASAAKKQKQGPTDEGLFLHQQSDSGVWCCFILKMLKDKSGWIIPTLLYSSMVNWYDLVHCIKLMRLNHTVLITFKNFILLKSTSNITNIIQPYAILASNFHNCSLSSL